MAAMYFTQTLLVFWLFENGFGYSDLIIYYAVIYAVALICTFLFSHFKFNLKSSILWGVLFSALGALVLMKIFNPAQLYLSAIFYGLNVVFFWIPYNIIHFKYSSEEKRGRNSGIYFLITPIIGITLRPIAGIVAEKFGFEIMFLIGILLYLIPIFLIRYLPDFEWDLDVKKELSIFKFNWSTFFQGVASRINWTLIPIFTLFFIKTPSQFGSFFGYLALVTAIASVINGYISDKIKNRKWFFYLFSILSVISFLPLAFIDNPYYWGIFAGINSLCFYLASPFWLTFNLDYYKDIGVGKAMILREIYLNLGYVFSLLIVFMIFYFSFSTKTSLIVISILSCFLPVVSYMQGIYRDKVCVKL